MSIPTLDRYPHGANLFIDGQPTILLGGQVHNSSTSCVESIIATFEKANKLNYNFVIGSISWLQFEPIEGQFDFSLLESQIRIAQEQNLKLVLIWFGAYKNAGSTYAPSWVRSNKDRFARAVSKKQQDSGRPSQGNAVLSVFSENLKLADMTAFQRLLRHLADLDKNHTVVMVQVENEAGLLGSSRDYSEPAEEAWNSHVPRELLASLEGALLPVDQVIRETWASAGSLKAGTWSEVFGDNWQAHEIFMAWHFASYIEALAKAGKAEKALPMYANAWLGPQAGQDQAGQWPSGGPSQNVIAIYKLAAPSLDFVSPDIYVETAIEQMAIYGRSDNPLFIPESRHNTGNLFWSIANHAAVGYAVFGGEDGRVGNQLSDAYAVLRQADQVIATAQKAGTIRPILLEDTQLETAVSFGNMTVKASNSRAKLKRFVEFAGLDLEIRDFQAISELEDLAVKIPSNADSRPFAMIIQESPTEFLLLGKGVNVDFEMPGSTVEIDNVEEGYFSENVWVPRRNLNGDERLNFLPLNTIGCAKVRVLVFEQNA